MRVNKKKNKKRLIIIIILVLIILAVGGFFIYQQIKLQKPIKEDWGQNYYVYLKDNKKDKTNIGIPNEAQDTKLKFVDINERKDPVMIITYKINKINYSNIYFIENNQVNSIIYQEPTNIELLYNISNQEYNYYFHIEKDGEDHYQSISEQIKDSEGNDENIEQTPEFTFNKDDVSSDTSVSKFDETFIKLDIEEDNYVILDDDLNSKELKETIESSIDKYEPQDKIITEEVKKEVDGQINELENKKDEIEKMDTDKAFQKMKGTWYNKKENLAVVLKVEMKTRLFVYGTYATDDGFFGKITDIKYKGDSIYQLNLLVPIYDDDYNEVDNYTESIDIDTSKINEKKIEVDGLVFNYLED